MDSTSTPLPSEQETAPQIATVTLSPAKPADAKLPAKVIARRQEKAQPQRTGKPEGWWSIGNVSGSPEGVARLIQDRTDIPTHWRLALQADIKVRCGTEFNFVYLDAHFYVEKGNATLHYTCQPDKKAL